VGRLSEQNDLGQARLVVLVDPAMASVAPLADRLLVLRGSPTDPLWLQTGLDQIRLVQLFKS
jgi:membrane protein